MRRPILSPLRVESGEMLHLDLLRFVASVGIVLAHSLEFLSPLATRGESHLRTGGLALFVDVFFVISGFVISHVYSDRLTSPRNYGVFLQRRAGRLLPLHLLTLAMATLVLIVLARLGIHMQHQPSVTPACVADAALLLNAMVPCGGMVPNGVSWSISAEMAMYVLFPLFLWLSGRRAARTAVLVAIALAGGVVAFGGLAAWSGELGVARAFPAFLLGMLFYQLRTAIARVRWPHAWFVLALSLFVGGGLLVWPPAVLVPLGYAIPLFAIAADRRGVVTPGVVRLAPLGQLTYSLYMLHGLIIMVLLNGLGDKLLHLRPLRMLALVSMTYALLGLLAWVSLQLFETPARRWIDSLPLFARRAGRPVQEAKADV